MRYKSEYCSCYIDVTQDKFLIQCPIHKEPNDVFRHNVGINRARGNKSRSEMKRLYFDKELPRGLKIAISQAGQRIIDKLRRAFRI